MRYAEEDLTYYNFHSLTATWHKVYQQIHGRVRSERDAALVNQFTQSVVATRAELKVWKSLEDDRTRSEAELRGLTL
jgi:hypothetical protein